MEYHFEWKIRVNRWRPVAFASSVVFTKKYIGIYPAAFGMQDRADMPGKVRIGIDREHGAVLLLPSADEGCTLVRPARVTRFCILSAPLAIKAITDVVGSAPHISPLRGGEE